MSLTESDGATRLVPRFHRLVVREVRRETSDAVSITFEIPPALQSAYDFAAGQYLTLRATLDGEDLRRSYSICSAPTDGELRIAVKQVPGGAFSTWVNTTLKPGESIDVMTPTGRFGTVPSSTEPSTYVGFAAGSGITPILSIIRATLAREPRAQFFLFYGNRTSNDMLFREALEDLKDRYMDRLSVFHVLSREQQDIEILNGRLDRAKITLLLGHVIPASAIGHAYICGPTEMSDELDAALRDLGLTEAQIHIERFVSAHDGRPRTALPPTAQAVARYTASLIIDGTRTDVPVADGEAVLDAALRAGLDLPYACKGGMCSTCRARVVDGKVAMTLNYSLEPWELAAGFVLTCQARPTTDRVVIDYDQV
jgi:ring-1,2-phenylacetyl-CoA epoxidase subunit PaaE